MEVLGGAAVALFIVFLGALRANLRREEGEAGALSATTVIAGSVVAAAALVALGVEDSELPALIAFPAATMLIAASLGILSTHALPAVVGFAGFAAAVVQLTAVWSAELALGALTAWAVLASLAMLRRSAC